MGFEDFSYSSVPTYKTAETSTSQEFVHEPLEVRRYRLNVEANPAPFDIEIHGKQVRFEGFSEVQGQWVGDVIKSLGVSMSGTLDKVQLSLTPSPEVQEAHGIAQYIAESRAMIIYGGLLAIAAHNDEIRITKSRAQQKDVSARPIDEGRHYMAQAIVHELVGHGKDPHLHARLERDKKGNQSIVLPKEIASLYPPGAVAEIAEREFTYLKRLCLQSIRTGLYIGDTNDGISYHRSVCATYVTAQTLGLSLEIQAQAETRMVFETRAILMEMRYRGKKGEKHLRELGRAQLESLSAVDSKEEQDGFTDPLVLSEDLLFRGIPETRNNPNEHGHRGNRGKLKRHIRSYHRALKKVGENPFRFIDEPQTEEVREGA